MKTCKPAVLKQAIDAILEFHGVSPYCRAEVEKEITRRTYGIAAGLAISNYGTEQGRIDPFILKRKAVFDAMLRRVDEIAEETVIKDDEETIHNYALYYIGEPMPL